MRFPWPTGEVVDLGNRLVTCLMFAALIAVSEECVAQSYYCLSGSQLLWSTPIAETTIDEIAAKCKPGDILSFSTKDPYLQTREGLKNADLIQRLCDFSKSIHMSPDGRTHCVVTEVRRIR